MQRRASSSSSSLSWGIWRRIYIQTVLFRFHFYDKHMMFLLRFALAIFWRIHFKPERTDSDQVFGSMSNRPTIRKWRQRGSEESTSFSRNIHSSNGKRTLEHMVLTADSQGLGCSWLDFMAECDKTNLCRRSKNWESKESVGTTRIYMYSLFRGRLNKVDSTRVVVCGARSRVVSKYVFRRKKRFIIRKKFVLPMLWACRSASNRRSHSYRNGGSAIITVEWSVGNISRFPCNALLSLLWIRSSPLPCLFRFYAATYRRRKRWRLTNFRWNKP